MIRKVARLLGRLIRYVYLVAIMLTSGVAVLAQTKPNEVTLPEPSGPYAVGRDAFDWTDENRDDPFAPTAGTKRSLTGFIWYPAAVASGERAPYLPHPVREALQKQANPIAASRAREVTVDPANVKCHSIDRAPLPPGKVRFPVLLMKPARGGLVLQYATLAEDLASHGYIVVGSDSPYTTPVVVHEDGLVIVRNAQGAPPENAPGHTSDLAPGQPNDLAVPVIAVWAQDNQFLLNRLATIDKDPVSRFAGRIDLRNVGAFGHSMGGAAALQFCKDDSHCHASADIDGALWGDVAVKGLRTPALFIFSDRPMLDRSNSENAQNPLVKAIDRIRSGLPNKPNLIVVRGTQHYNFADSALLSEIHFARSTNAIGTIDPLRAIEITREQLQLFFDRYLKGTDSASAITDNLDIRFE